MANEICIMPSMKYYGITLGHYSWKNYSEHYFVSENGKEYLEITEPLSKENVDQLADFFATHRNVLTFTKPYLKSWSRANEKNVWVEYEESEI